MRNAHVPEGATPHQAAQDYRRENNEEMWHRLGLPRVEVPDQNARRAEHNIACAIRRAIFQYLEEIDVGH